jgi:ribosomal protein S18 acetylase RimI-like enzyme
MRCNRLVTIGDLELTLRSCRQDDIGFVYELMRCYLEEPFNRFTSEKWSRKRFKEGFCPERITIVEHEGMPIGFYDLEMGEAAYVHNLHLSGDYKGKGVGPKFIDYVLSEAFRDGASTIKAKVFLSNDKMIRFLTQHGFIIEQSLPQENSVIVKRVLTGA